MPEGNQKNIVFLIAGIDITPVCPCLKTWKNDSARARWFFFYTNRTASSAAYHEVFQHTSLKNFCYIAVTTSTTKRIDIELLKSQLADLHDFEFYLVGTTPFLNPMKAMLINEGIDLVRIKEGDFG